MMGGYFPEHDVAALTPKVEQKSMDCGRAIRRLIVMDDELSILTLTKAILEKKGFRVTTVETGDQAICSFRSAHSAGDPFDLALLDLTMPGGFGACEVLCELKQIDSDLRAIVTSGNTSSAVMLEWKRYGFAAAIAKPYRFDALLQLMDDLI